MGVVSKKLRDSAKGQECKFGVVGVCTNRRDTVVLCHIRDDSKGMGNKANDWSAAFGCSACHQVIDEHRLTVAMEAYYCLRAMQRTHQIWRDMGLIVIAGDNEKPRKPSSKTLPRRALGVGSAG
jgi:hypothetical protein